MKLNPITLTLTLLIVTLAGCTGGTSNLEPEYTGGSNPAGSGTNADGEPRYLKLNHNGEGLFVTVETTGDMLEKELGSRAYQGSTELTTSLFIEQGGDVSAYKGCHVNGDGIRNSAKDCVRYISAIIKEGETWSICQLSGETVADKIVFTDLVTDVTIGTFSLVNLPECRS